MIIFIIEAPENFFVKRTARKQFFLEKLTR